MRVRVRVRVTVGEGDMESAVRVTVSGRVWQRVAERQSVSGRSTEHEWQSDRVWVAERG